MGVVYKAEDTKLDRPVALKFLPNHLLGDEEVKKRFEREAKAAAALDHANVCHVHEIDEVDGKTFIAMSLIEGEPLDQKIERGPLKLEEALDIAQQIAKGLEAAHKKGVVHRDIKPQNIMVGEDGHVTIMDFGLAQLTQASLLTRPDQTLGTTFYMSPEQTQGSGTDHRTDIWALGVVLYEMVVGERPFKGDYDKAVMYSILNEEPEPITAVRTGVPMQLEDCVGKCLAKSAESRYQSTTELIVDLKRLDSDQLGASTQARAPRAGAPALVSAPAESAVWKQRAPWALSVALALLLALVSSLYWTQPRGAQGLEVSPSELPRVAVLPLKTGEVDPEIESFADGMTEEITAGLSQFRHLLVISASVAASLEGNADVREVGKELDARFILDGSVRRAGSSMRVSLQLLDAATGAHLWAERFDRDLGVDLFAVQDELADRIVATIADPFGVLTRSLGDLVKAKPIDSLTAHEGVLLAFAHWERELLDTHAKTRTVLEQAVRREPNHADALACLSRLYLDEHKFSFNVQPNSLDRALEVAQRAVEADATSTLAFFALAEAHYFRREANAFRSAADRAISLNPRNTYTAGQLAYFIAISGEWERGREIAREVMQLNPHHAPALHYVFVDDHYFKGEYEQALEIAEQMRMPGHFYVQEVLAAINGQLGRREEARKHLERFVELAPDVARNIRAEHSKWYHSEELVELRLEGLRKAGLDVDGGEGLISK